jgi:hypothetical protein
MMQSTHSAISHTFEDLLEKDASFNSFGAPVSINGINSNVVDTVPSSFQDDWMNQLPMLDLPQFFTSADLDLTRSDNHVMPSISDFVSRDKNNNSTSINNSIQFGQPLLNADLLQTEELDSSVKSTLKRTQQHRAPGPSRRQRSKSPESPLSPQSPDSSNEPAIRTAVTFTREELLKFTSEDLERFEKQITATRPLTPEEKKELKRQRRLIKNRESAQLSRRRKKERIDELEEAVTKLAHVHGRLDTQLKSLQHENTILKAEVAQLMSVIRDSPVLSGLLVNVTSWVVLYSIAQAIRKHGIKQAEIPPIFQQIQQIQFSPNSEVSVSC